MTLPLRPPSLYFFCTVASGASGSFSTNSPASPLSSISLTSPLSPFSPVPGSKASPTKQLGPEVSTGHTQQGTNPNSKPGTGICSDSRNNPEVHRRSSPKPPPKSCTVLNLKSDPKHRCRSRSYRESEASLHTENGNHYGCETYEHSFPLLDFQNHGESSGRLDPVIEETDQNINYRNNFNYDQLRSRQQSLAKTREGEQICFLQVQCQDKYNNQHLETVQTHSGLQEISWLSSDGCIQEVRVGLRKDVYPDSHPPEFSARNLSSNRRFSFPESQILLLHDSFHTDVLCHSPDLYAPSAPCFRSTSPKTQHRHQLASRSLRHAGAGARPLTYPNNQGDLVKGLGICAITLSDNNSGKVFMQSNL